MSSARSASMTSPGFIIWPSFIRNLMTSTARSDMRCDSSWMVMVSGRMTSRDNLFARFPASGERRNFSWRRRMADSERPRGCRRRRARALSASACRGGGRLRAFGASGLWRLGTRDLAAPDAPRTRCASLFALLRPRAARRRRRCRRRRRPAGRFRQRLLRAWRPRPRRRSRGSFFGSKALLFLGLTALGFGALAGAARRLPRRAALASSAALLAILDLTRPGFLAARAGALPSRRPKAGSARRRAARLRPRRAARASAVRLRRWACRRPAADGAGAARGLQAGRRRRRRLPAFRLRAA